ncbi:TIGR01777 family oxidoreductase [Bergeyella sp. RCAD1439]|uniref:TIGR01777 family oxidoreductase n=1 Tax=Bergeyella anatis TaxID=3113737 RepID=UPI002E1970CA|nr:TIGR01777 family oxidoreductase [Bergeyella sp. RCAD1439]
MVILISGTSGLVGRSLKTALERRGHKVKTLTRTPNPKNETEFYWDYNKGVLDDNALQDVDAIIHLAGANLAKRWTTSYKKEILSSRIDSADFLRHRCLNLGHSLKSFVSASGINYYGTFTSDEILTEQSSVRSQDFLSFVCREWELAADRFSEVAQRIVKIRTAPVLAPSGGALEPLARIARLHLSSAIGSGNQWFNWIHHEDLTNLYIAAVENENLEGAYNAVADEIPTNKTFMKALAKVLNKNFLPLPLPGLALRLAIGEMSEMLLEGTRASNEKIKATGFTFRYPLLNQALIKNLK